MTVIRFLQFKLVKAKVQFKHFVAVKMTALVFLSIDNCVVDFTSEGPLNMDTLIIQTLWHVPWLSVFILFHRVLHSPWINQWTVLMGLILIKIEWAMNKGQTSGRNNKVTVLKRWPSIKGDSTVLSKMIFYYYIRASGRSRKQKSNFAGFSGTNSQKNGRFRGNFRGEFRWKTIGKERPIFVGASGTNFVGKRLVLRWFEESFRWN